ncbi:MAG TPA: hypothetical protein VJO99_11845 [Burkholderiaceae bacterium]|nr:hypothetical protein [Burkholderiaceae bacterium]
MNWDSREYQRQRQTFFAGVERRQSMLLITTLIFTVTWLVGWGCSALLLHVGWNSMPLRYAASFLVSYAAFFGCARLWCNQVAERRGGFDVGSLDPGVDGDGCLVLLAALALALVVGGLFWMSGGFAALIEAAFEVAFAGTIVRRLGRTERVGHWARALFAGTWPQALAMCILLVGIAATLQRAAPGAITFADAVIAVWARH